MKRSFQVLIVVISLCFLSGCCVSSKNYTQPDTMNYSFNNCSAMYNTFWLTEDGLYHSKGAPFLGKHVFQTTESKVTYLASIWSEIHSTFMVCENNVYVIEFDDYRDSYLIREYNMSSNTSKKIGYFEDLQDAFVFQNKLFYTQNHFGEQENRISLQIYDLETEQATCIHENVFFAGVMDNQVAYVSRENTTFHIYSYKNGESKEIGSFVYDLESHDYYISHGNFTSNKILFSSEKSLVCYDTTTKQLQVFEFDNWIGSLIAYENYAFVVTAVYDDPNQFTLYRICLSDGSKEYITQNNLEIFSTYVDSDDYVYVKQPLGDTIYRYTPDGERTVVYKDGFF